jgi:uracil phosphoribosyltransferase
MSLQIVKHPLAAHQLAALRDQSTPPSAFRRHVRQLATLLAVEATRDLPTVPGVVVTPLGPAPCERLSVTLGIVPILRAGLGMVDPLLELMPEAQVWHLGLYRDETTALPVEYYSKLPPSRPVAVACVLDPMLATGGSASAALTALRSWGVGDVRLLSIIAAEEGVRRVEREFPEIRIHVCAVDPRLDERKFIVPGLGDAGDRMFNTLV